MKEERDLGGDPLAVGTSPAPPGFPSGFSVECHSIYHTPGFLNEFREIISERIIGIRGKSLCS